MEYSDDLLKTIELSNGDKLYFVKEADDIESSLYISMLEQFQAKGYTDESGSIETLIEVPSLFAKFCMRIENKNGERIPVTREYAIRLKMSDYKLIQSECVTTMNYLFRVEKKQNTEEAVVEGDRQGTV